MDGLFPFTNQFYHFLPTGREEMETGIASAYAHTAPF